MAKVRITAVLFIGWRFLGFRFAVNRKMDEPDRMSFSHHADAEEKDRD
jgi:hypothetical protein